ncbi:ABC transporter ATP-binding protein [Achromobacter sp. F4_2707]|uniref:ABC transporter ATP-binding protein n=1 Tax=Achromobacter sp. F4_2707 TaxID=3114286 RepID=UPI0039C6EF51
MSKPILEIKNLRKSFGGVNAVSGVNLTVKEKETLAIIGPNGAGKTTFYNLLSGRMVPSGGSILLNGQDITGLPPHKVSRMGISRSFQINNIFTDFTVRENVEVALTALHKQSRRWYNFASNNRQIQEEAEKILERLALKDLAHQRAGTISYGDKRLLEIAVVLATAPSIVLLDEPTAGMTPEETRKVINLIHNLSSTGEYTFLITEHDMEVVFSVADRIMVMHRGSPLVIGEPEEVRQNPEVRVAYLGEELEEEQSA